MIQNIIRTISFILILNAYPVVLGQSDTLTQKAYVLGGFSDAAYPDDSLTYNQYVGETIAGYFVADGWRRDTVNGGYNKEMYFNPYVESVRFEKEDFDINRGGFVAYYYKDGFLYNGAIEDTFSVSFTPDQIKGHLYGRPYYESVNLTVVMRATCVNGRVEGRAVLCAFIPTFGLYNNIVLSECNFEKGEMVGSCKHYDLNSVNVTYSDGKIHSRERNKDYFEFKNSMKVEELFYQKGSADARKSKSRD